MSIGYRLFYNPVISEITSLLIDIQARVLHVSLLCARWRRMLGPTGLFNIDLDLKLFTRSGLKRRILDEWLSSPLYC